MFEDLREIDSETWLQFAGRLHVLVVHFPIALLLTAAFLELVRLRRGRFEPRPAAVACLGVGALAACVAAALGWIYAAQEPPGAKVAETLFRHRWLGIAVAGSALLVWFDALAQRNGTTAGRARRLRFELLVVAGVVAACGHFGGTLAWGPGFVTEPFDDWRAGRRANSTGTTGAPTVGATVGATGAPASGSDAPDPGQVAQADPTGPAPGFATPDFATEVWPLFEERCLHCHGPRKQKGALRLDRAEDLFGDGVFEGVVVRGYADSSELVRRIELPADDPDVMPADGDFLDADQLRLLRAWIDAGAPFDAELAAELGPVEAPKPPEDGSSGDAAGG